VSVKKDHDNGRNDWATLLLLGYSGGAVPDLHRVPCTSAFPREWPTTNATTGSCDSMPSPGPCQRAEKQRKFPADSRATGIFPAEVQGISPLAGGRRIWYGSRRLARCRGHGKDGTSPRRAARHASRPSRAGGLSPHGAGGTSAHTWRGRRPKRWGAVISGSFCELGFSNGMAALECPRHDPYIRQGRGQAARPAEMERATIRRII
jgi:hypothetical protein